MALIVPNWTRCVICHQLVCDGRRFVGFTTSNIFRLPEEFWKFNDAAVHADCFDAVYGGREDIPAEMKRAGTPT